MRHRLDGLTTTADGRKAYFAWANCRRRCYEPEAKQYKDYGGRGIRLQADWADNPTAFCDYVLGLPSFAPGLTLDRVDNDGNYEEGNLRWVDKAAQARNRRKYVSNKSGVTGVGFYAVQRNGYVDTYARCTWVEAGKMVMRTLNVREYGLIPAFAEAFKLRQKMIDKLNSAGAGYSEKHGN